jgi:2-phosphoglycerate kinase
MVDDSQLVIIDQEGSLPFSKGLMAQSLMATGLQPERAYNVAAAVQRDLRRTKQPFITLAGLRAIARETLGDADGDALMESFRQWQELRHMERPLIILIGGTTGVGKSTLATQVAHRLGITRVASTDMVRQVMRAFFSADLMPAIHYSSFDAADAVRVPVAKSADLSKVGFIEQTESVTVGIEALVERAVDEAQSMVIEGVHIVPGFLDRDRWREALVLQFVLAVHDPGLHRSHFTVREWETGGIRPLRRYVEHFRQIRSIQKFILARAEKEQVMVIENESIDLAIKEVMAEILRAVSEYQRPLDHAGE